MRKIFGVLALSMLGLAGCSQRQEMQEYVDANAGRLKARQERILGIHYEKMPAIKMRPGYGVEVKMGLGTQGYFTPVGYTTIESGRIIRPPGEIILNDARTFLPGQNPQELSLIGAILNSGRTLSIEQAIDHELIHAYSDQIINTRYPWEIREGKPLPPRTKEEKTAFLLVEEGIAEYGTKKIHPDYHNYPSIFSCDGEFPVGYEPYEESPREDPFKGRTLKFKTGYCLVKPVLETGFANGVLKFAQNPIKAEYLQDIEAYQKRVLEAPILDDHGKPVRRQKSSR